MLIVRSNYLRRVSIGISQPNPDPVPQTLTGLDFPSNGQVADSNSASVRFKFTGVALIPIFGTNGAGVTYLWKYRPRQQTGFYTAFFWANDDGLGTVADTFLWNGNAADTYYGPHPYPHDGTNPLGSSGTQHRWEIAVEQNDFVDANDPVVKDVWYSQAFRASGAVNAIKNHEFNWSLPVDSTKRVTRISSGTWGNTNPPFPALTFGDAPWQPGKECLSGILRGIQIYDALLTDAQINTLQVLENDTDVLAQAVPGLHYLNMNPTPSDISDKSGNGNNPQWFNANRPTLWTE